jgi:hypothetical protein
MKDEKKALRKARAYGKSSDPASYLYKLRTYEILHPNHHPQTLS